MIRELSSVLRPWSGGGRRRLRGPISLRGPRGRRRPPPDHGPRLLGLVVATTLFATSAFAQQATPPGPGQARPVTLPKIVERKLPNGLTVVVAPLKNVPKVTAILAMRVGQAAGRETHAGIAQLTGGLLTEGTDSRTSKQLKEELRSIGGGLFSGVDTDATTVQGSALSEFSGRFFEILSDVAQSPAFPETEVALAKENAVQGLRQARSNPNFLGNEQLQKAVFGSHPYSFVVGTEQSIAAISREDLRRFAATYYMPNTAHLVVVGDVEPEATFAQVERAFGSWKGGAAPADTWPSVPARDKRQITFVHRPGSIQSVIFVGAPAIPRNDPEYFPLRTANVILGGSFYSRLTKNIREEKGYTYSPSSGANTLAKAGSFVVSASVRNEVTGPTLLEVFYELDRMRVAPVTNDEMSAAKTYSKGNFSIELASQFGLAGRINTVYLYGLPRDFIETFGQKVDALTTADVGRAAARFFDTYRCAVVVVGDYEKVKDQVTPFGDVTVYDVEGKLMR
jgi:zinc protease